MSLVSVDILLLFKFCLKGPFGDWFVAVDFINTCRNVMNDCDLRHYRGLALIRWHCLDRVLARYFQYFKLPPHSAHDEPMTGQTVCFTLIYFSFMSNHQQKYRKGHVFQVSNSNPRTFLIKHLTCYNFCEYPVSLKLLLNILYPNNFFLKYPVSR